MNAVYKAIRVAKGLMKRINRAAITTTLLVLSFCEATASTQASAMANASANVIQGIKMSRVSDLQFGSFVSGIPGTVTISPSGSRSANGPLALSSANYPVSAASFLITGEDSLVFNIILPDSASLQGPSGSKMTVNQFVSNPSHTGTLSSRGTATLSVGATLNVGSNQTGGTYSGTFPVTVTYQ